MEATQHNSPLRSWFDEINDFQRRDILKEFYRKKLDPNDGDLRTVLTQYLNTNAKISYDGTVYMLGRSGEAFREYLLQHSDFKALKD